MLQSVLRAFGLNQDLFKVTAFGSGLINYTWRIKNHNEDYILQRINNTVFKQPLAIAHNIQNIGEYLQQYHPEYLFVTPIKTTTGEEIFHDENEGYFRLFPFIKNSHTIDVVQSPMQAYEAAKQFGKFTRLLSGFDYSHLKITLPDFHNLSLRYDQFKQSLIHGNEERVKEAASTIYLLKQHTYIVEEYEKIKTDPDFKIRVTHHDTKISNILFDESSNGLCVIDLDTVMPGYFISDVGDMMRTYLSPASEEEKDFSAINVREEFYKAIVEGYGSEMKDELTPTEKKYFVYAGKFMIYMQALRFLSDYLNNDIYYGSRYPAHNFVRANNQMVLLQHLLEKEKIFSRINRQLLKT